MLTAENLHKVYNSGIRELHVLKGVTLTVAKGEILSIFGPSGAGKSTLLHLLAGLDKPTKGAVTINGKDIFTLSEDERSRLRNKTIGFIFQFYHLLEEFNALENVMLPGLVTSWAQRSILRNRATGLLKEIGLEKRLYHRPSELSGGEQQRVAIARALMNEPEIVFCDEPTGNLDSETSRDVLDLIIKLNKTKMQTFVIVTHEESIAQFAHRVLHIRDGKFLE
ncbi:MAG: ABC transporter ATP-binding protein [Candidatus Omnitrophota bacterium]